jgi:polyhydroxyalkanoate synthesis regulator phasin
MASNERIRKYLDAGTVLGQVSRGRAEEIVRELVNAGDIQRSQAQEWVDNLVERSHKSSEQVLELVRHEVASQLQKIDPRSLESLANQVADVLKKSAKAGRNATKDVTTRAGKAAQDATSKAGKTAKGVTAQASKTAKDVTTQAGKTATRARDAAANVTPSRLPGIKTKTSPGSAKSDAKKSDAKKSHNKKVTEANNSASKKAAS